MTRSLKMAGFIVLLILALALQSPTPVQATTEQTVARANMNYAIVASKFTHSVTTGRYDTDEDTGKGCYMIGSKAKSCYVIGSKAKRVEEQDAAAEYQPQITVAEYQPQITVAEYQSQIAKAKRIAKLEAEIRRVAAMSEFDQSDFEEPNAIPAD
jgi:hypothetical protein